MDKNTAIENEKTTTTTTKRPYHRRSKEEIEAEKKAKAERAAAGAAKKNLGTEPDVSAVVDAVEGEPAPKKVTGKKAAPANPGSKIDRSVFGTWSDERYPEMSDLPMINAVLNIEIELLSKSLGMTPSNPEALKYVAKKDDEQDPYGDEGPTERAVTIWPKAKFIPNELNGAFTLVNEPKCVQVDMDETIELPFIYDYQIRGMFKDSCGLLSRAKNNNSSALTAYKKWVDGNIFVAPRKIAWQMPASFQDDMGEIVNTYDENGRLNTLARALRTGGPNGPNNAISISEVVPPHSRLRFQVLLTDPKIIPTIAEWFDYGMVHGLGQWRNSGIGIFRWRMLDENWEPFQVSAGDEE